MPSLTHPQHGALRYYCPSCGTGWYGPKFEPVWGESSLRCVTPMVAAPTESKGAQ